MMQIFKVVASIIPVLFLCAEASAEISGSNDVAFRTAMTQWLDDDDRQALPALSSLAHNGNKAARYLLAQIERTTHFATESSFMKSQNRQERISLLRIPKGLGGTSWLEALQQDGEQLAAMLLEFKHRQIEYRHLDNLIKAGEKRLLDYRKHGFLATGDNDLVRKLGKSGNLKTGEHFLLWFENLLGWRFSDKNVATDEEKQDSMQAMKADFQKQGIDSALFFVSAYKYLSPKTKETDRAFHFGSMLYPSHFNSRHHSHTTKEISEFGDWLLYNSGKTEQLTLPYNICQTHCPNSIGTCMAGTVDLSGGYFELARFTSPLENLISQEDYLSSDRAMNSILRRMKWQAEMRNHNAFSKLDVCLNDTLEITHFKY